MQIRPRVETQVLVKQEYGGAECEGPSSEQRDCEVMTCPGNIKRHCNEKIFI